MPRNDDISLILTKAKKQGWLPDVADSELDALEKEANVSFYDDGIFNRGNHTGKYRSGCYYGPDNRTASTVALAVGFLSAVPFFVNEKITIDRIAAEVTTAAATATVSLGIYSSKKDTQLPDSLIFETADQDASTTGVKEVTVSQTLSPGLYYLALNNKVAAVTVRSFSSTLHLPPVAATSFAGAGATLENNCFATSGVNGAMPATWASTLTGAGAPKIMVRIV